MTIIKNIPIIEFRRLLHEISDYRPDIGVRMRVMGEMWHPLHLRIFQLTEKGVALYEELSRKLVMVSDLSQVMQFEIDQVFKHYQPHFHYSVDPALVSH
jgi:histone H3/H4